MKHDFHRSLLRVILAMLVGFIIASVINFIVGVKVADEIMVMALSAICALVVAKVVDDDGKSSEEDNDD